MFNKSKLLLLLLYYYSYYYIASSYTCSPGASHAQLHQCRSVQTRTHKQACTYAGSGKLATHWPHLPGDVFCLTYTIFFKT